MTDDVALSRPYHSPDWAGWHYPEAPVSGFEWAYKDRWNRQTNCTICGAPPGAMCVSNTGRRRGLHYA